MRAVNLLPRDEPRRKAQGISLQTQLTTFAPVLAVIVLGSGWYITKTQVHERQTKLDGLKAEVSKLPPPKHVPAIDPTLLAEHDARVAALGTALSQRIAWDRILREISSILPEDVWLTGLDATSPAVPAPAPPPAPTDTTSTSTSASEAAAGSPPPPPPPPPPSTDVGSSPLVINGYTYSQASVARFLARLSVIPELDAVNLVSSTLTNLGSRSIVQFQITADIRPPGAS
jgi:Tfp pilus assembly protein PilN